MKYYGKITDPKDLVTAEYVDTHGGKIDHIEIDGVEQTIVNKTVDIELFNNLIKYSEQQPSTPWVIWCKPEDNRNYLCFDFVFADEYDSAICSITFNGDDPIQYPELQYSIGDKEHWQDYSIGDYAVVNGYEKRIYWRGLTDYFSSDETYYAFEFGSAGGFTVHASGEIDSLINWNPLTPYCFQYLFEDCYELVTPPEFPSTELAEGCYMGMFSECQLLSSLPELPSRVLPDLCYAGMFFNCGNIIILGEPMESYYKPYAIPSEPPIYNSGEDSVVGMFEGIGFFPNDDGTPLIDTLYYYTCITDY